MKCKLFYATSEMPKIKETDTGIWRRLNLSNEKCWETGNYTNSCDCKLCLHKTECSGYEGDDTE